MQKIIACIREAYTESQEIGTTNCVVLVFVDVLEYIQERKKEISGMALRHSGFREALELVDIPDVPATNIGKRAWRVREILERMVKQGDDVIPAADANIVRDFFLTWYEIVTMRPATGIA